MDKELNGGENEDVSTRAYSPTVKRNIRQSLVVATRQSNHSILQEALDHFCSVNGESEDQEIIAKAHEKLFVLESSQFLRESLRNKKVDDIKKRMKEIKERDKKCISRDRCISQQLRYELSECRKFLKTNTWSTQRKIHDIEKSNSSVVTKDTLVDLRSCNQPADAVHRLLQSALLLLGEDEDLTEEWRYCRRMMSNTSKHRHKFLYGFEYKDCNKEIVARSKEILSGITQENARQCSLSAVCIYNFTKGTIELYEKDITLDGVIPADIERQREIFKRPLSARTLRDRKLHKVQRTRKFDIVEPVLM